jgi:hypothetical protein
MVTVAQGFSPAFGSVRLQPDHGKGSMRKDFRLSALALVAAVGIACGSPGEQAAPPGSTPATETSAGTPGTPAVAPGDARGEAPAEARAKEPVITTMPMDVPPGTDLVLTLETSVSSETAKADQPVRATVAKPVVVAGMEVIPVGALVTGAIVSAEQSGKVKGRASIALRFNEVVVLNTPYRISTARISRQAETTKGEDAKKIGIGAGVGTAIGAIAGGKKGAAIGAGIGGGAGTGVVLATRGKEVTIPAGATLQTKITETVRIVMPM